MANNFAQYQLVADRTLYILENSLAYSKRVNMRYGEEYENQPHGPTLQVKRPPRYTIRQGDAVALQNVTEPTVTLTVKPVFGVDIPIGSSEMALILGNNLKDWDSRVGRPAASQLASEFERNIAALNTQFYNMVGVNGTPPATLAALAPSMQRLDEEAVPQNDRAAVFSPSAYWGMVPGLTGNFVKPVIDKAEMHGSLDMPILGLENGIAMSQITAQRTTGTFTGTPLVNGATQQGTSLVTNGWGAASFLNVGDVITIAGVFAINPQTRVSTSVLRNFVVAALSTADAGGNMTITLGNSLNPPIGGVDQQFQSVDSFPANGAAITVLSGTTGQALSENLVFQRDAILCVTLPQMIPPNAFYAEQREYDGVAFRCWIDGDIRNNQVIMRLDILAAFGVGNKEALVRLTN